MNSVIKTEIYAKNFLRYQAEMERIGELPRLAEFDWFEFPENISVRWIAYSFMLPEYARVISNTLNALGNYSQRLLAWHCTLEGLDEDDRLALAFEFVEPITVLATSLPQVIKSRFVFAITQLSHQANKAIDEANWKDDLPDQGCSVLFTEQRS